MRTVRDIRELHRGDVIQHRATGVSYVVIDDLADGKVVAVRSMIVEKPMEWLLMLRAAEVDDATHPQVVH